MATVRTSLRRVSWVHQDHWNPSQPGFVLNELSQLSKRPGGQCSSLGLPDSPYPPLDALEIFNGNSTRGAFSLSYDVLANLVVDVGGEPAFLPATFLEQPLGGLRSFLL